MSSSLICGPCVRKSQKSARVRGSPPKALFSVRVISTQADTRNRRGRSAQPVRYMPPSSTGVRLVEPLRSCFVAGSGMRDRKSALPFALHFRYSRVYSNAMRNSSHLWTRALWFPTLPMLSRALWSIISGTWCPKGSRGGA